MRQKEECNEDWRPGLNAFLCSHPAPAWTRGRGLLWGVARLGSHWLPGGSARRIKLWSILPTFYSPRTQTQSTPLARSVQLLLCRVCGPKIDSQGQLGTARDSQSREPGKGRGTGVHPVQVSIFRSIKWDDGRAF